METSGLDAVFKWIPVGVVAVIFLYGLVRWIKFRDPFGTVISGGRRDPLGRVDYAEDLGIGTLEMEWGELLVYPRENGDDVVQIGLKVRSRTNFAIRAMKVPLDTSAHMATALREPIPPGAAPIVVSRADCRLVVFPIGSNPKRPQQVRFQLRQEGRLEIDGYMTESQVRWLGDLIERSVSGAT